MEKGRGGEEKRGGEKEGERRGEEKIERRKKKVWGKQERFCEDRKERT